MSRLIYITLVWLLQLTVANASTFNLRVEISPISAGSLNTEGGVYEDGSNIYLQTYNYNGYVFKGWYEGDSLLSPSSSFYYCMPAKDVIVQARYEYDPEVPANPDPMEPRYTLTLICKPVGGGSFNISSEKIQGGSSVHLFAYPNTGYKFVHWENEKEESISVSQDFYYEMTSEDTKLYGVFEFDPDVPGNPNKNYWNKELGEVIVDDYNPGSLISAISAAIGKDSPNDVAMITVAGRMNYYDFGVANSFPNCTLLDISRVTGVTEIPSYAFDNTKLESLYLPATVEKIGYASFCDCKQLAALTIYAMTPPTLEGEVFTGVPEGLVVYVPASSIFKYQDADGWKNYTILPIQEDIRNLTISLPEDTNAQDYAMMWLELNNTKNGQKMHYVMTDRMQYTFANIICNTTWNVVLRNERGDVFGQIDNVEVKDEDVSVSFTTLSKPQNLMLTVKTPDGQDVTNLTQITWNDASGNYMAQGVPLKGFPSGCQVNCRLVLSKELAMVYETPQALTYTLKEDDNNLICQLDSIKQVLLSGKVKDASTGLSLNGAVISASQTFGGKYSKTLIAKTDGNGVFTLNVSNVPTSVAYAATDFISQTVVCDSLLNGDAEVTLPEISLKPIFGATIAIDFTYTTDEGETQNRYSDYQNVSFTLQNLTKNQTISQFNVQYPQIVLLENVEDGDELKITATSRTNVFMPVESMVTIADQTASALFAITELGKIHSTFEKNNNTTVVGSLYDTSGKLIKTYNYSGAQLTITNLTDGQYTLVTMGGSRLFNTIYDLAQLPQTGLAEGTDYVQNSVEVKSGTISTIHNDEVPTLDESKLYYTGDNTSFTVNKPSIVAGNYLTLTGRIDFKPAYVSSVSNVQMIVDLPESCQFVENSVMVGNSTSDYTLNGQQLIIPMLRYTDRVRFCIIPTLGGEFAPSAFTQFTLNGKAIKQPIGSANYTAKDLSINVPSTVAKTTIPVSGTSIGASAIEIYDNGVLIGQTTSLANGTWSTTCELNEAKNHSLHDIYAIVKTKNGITLQSETQTLIYNTYAIVVSSVKMINTAHGPSSLDLLDYVTNFDFVNPSSTPQTYWYWPNYPSFTFLIDLTNNDTTIVSNVKIHVKTTANNVVTIPAAYHVKKNVWVAKSEFYSYALPTNVSVTYDYMDYSMVDSLAFINALEKDYRMVNIIDYTDEKDVLTYTVQPWDNSLSLICSYYRTTIDQKEQVYKKIANSFFEKVDIDESSFRYYIYDNIAYQIVKETSDSIFVFSTFSINDQEIFNQYVGLLKGTITPLSSRKGFTRTWEYGTIEDSIPPSTDPLNQWRDRIISRAIEEANSKLECQDDIGRMQIHNAIAKLRQCVGFSLGGFLAYTAGWALAATPGDHPIERAYQLWDASNDTDTFAEGISGLSYAAQQHLKTIHDAPRCRKSNGSNGNSDGESGNENARNVMDPSGFVYEGVSSNRIEGVTATVYYKEMVEDMYGDLHESIVKWDASEYLQENPLFTDEFGMYAWDVPQGLWQVKFEKEGYETTYSEWLPVPPPQLDINIPMKQNIQPTVKLARAFEDAVEVEFDKYMVPEFLTTDNIMVMQGDKAVKGTIELLNEEVSYEGETETFASKVRFNAAQPFTEKEITLIVNNRVKSYADIRMQDDYQQTFAIEKEIKQILSDSLIVVEYGEKAALTVSVLPASASKGKTLCVRNSSPMILGVEAEQVTIGEDGKAEISISGELPGTAALIFTIEGTDKTAITIANVKQTDSTTVAAPTASIASGSVVEKGTQVSLFCETEGAIIYYTIDGSCPCDENGTRAVYDGTPIVIDKSMTVKAMAVAKDLNDSEIAEFIYTVLDGDGVESVIINDEIQVYPLPVRDILNISADGQIIKNVKIMALNGRTITTVNKPAKTVTLDVSSMASGVYIVFVTLENGNYSRKFVKVQ